MAENNGAVPPGCKLPAGGFFGRLHVLVVDDDAAYLEELKLMLLLAGYAGPNIYVYILCVPHFLSCFYYSKFFFPSCFVFWFVRFAVFLLLVSYKGLNPDITCSMLGLLWIQ